MICKFQLILFLVVHLEESRVPTLASGIFLHCFQYKNITHTTNNIITCRILAINNYCGHISKCSLRNLQKVAKTKSLTYYSDVDFKIFAQFSQNMASISCQPRPLLYISFNSLHSLIRTGRMCEFARWETLY
jgi:hypothetical protein